MKALSSVEIEKEAVTEKAPAKKRKRKGVVSGNRFLFRFWITGLVISVLIV